MSAVTLTRDEDGVLHVAGELTLATLNDASARFEQLRQREHRFAAIDLSALARLDTAGALLLVRSLPDIPITFRDDAQRDLLQHIASLEIESSPPPQAAHGWRQSVIGLGRATSAMCHEAYRIVAFTGQALAYIARGFLRPDRVRWGAVSQYIYQIGIEALPIIGLMAFLIAIVLAYQGVAQLRPYGGEQFTVNLVALSILREMGVLLTAIMVAGRSGSAFTAEIGVMKSREEVDALQVMGLDPFAMLVTPRLIAIIITLPLLTFYADIMGLVGGYLITHSLIDISLAQYIDRVHLAAQGNDLLVGMIKAPVFALFIGMVGCMHGLRVSGSAESIGKETTRSVVKSIFLVLVLDAFFSILFEKIGL